MTSTGRAADPPFEDGAPRTAAHRTPGMVSTPAAVPGVPEPTVEPADPDTGGSTVHQADDDDPGWAASVTGRFGHYIDEGAIRVEHHSRRLAAYGVCGVHGFIDERGLDEGARLPHCPECERRLAPRVDWP